MKSSPEVYQMLQDYKNSHKNIEFLQEERKRAAERIELIDAQINRQVCFIEEVQERFPKLIEEVEFISSLGGLELPDGKHTKHLGIY